MRRSFTGLDLQTLLTFPFRDPEWRRKGWMGSLMVSLGFIVPILPSIILMGYVAQIMKGIIEENKDPFLPEWDDWGKLINDGWKPFAVSFVIMLPIFVILFLGIGLAIGGPAIVISLAEAGEGSGQSGIGYSILLGILIVMPIFFLIMASILIIAGIFLPAALGHVVAKDDFMAVFRIREWWPIFWVNLSGFLLSYVISVSLVFVANFAIQILIITIVLCILVPLILSPITFYTTLISYTLDAQAYRTGVQMVTSKNNSVQ